MSGSIRVLVADDHRLFRAGLRLMLEAEPGIEVVGEAEDGRAVMEMVAAHCPDVVVMDMFMPLVDGMNATRQLASKLDGPKVIVLSCQSGDRFVSAVLGAGAAAYLRKDDAVGRLVLMIRSVVAGDAGAGSVVGGDPVNAGRNPTPAAGPVVLSARERDVVTRIAEGDSTKQVAIHLHVSIKTVETHRRRIFAKLGIESVAALTKYAIREGLTTMEVKGGNGRRT